MVILHLVIQTCISTPGTFVNIPMNKFSYSLHWWENSAVPGEVQTLSSMVLCCRRHTQDPTGFPNSLQHFCRLEQFPGICCLTITIPHGVPKCGSLLTDVETGWLTDQFKVSEEVRSEKVLEIFTLPDPLSQNDGSNTSSHQCTSASVSLQSVF